MLLFRKFSVLLFLLSLSQIAQGQQRRQAIQRYNYLSATSSDSRFFAVNKYLKSFEFGKFSYYNMVRVYHVRSRRYVSNLKFIGSTPPDWMRFSPNGRKLLIKTGTEYLLLDIRSRKRQQKVRNSPSVGFLEGGRKLATQSGSQLKVYDIVSESFLDISYRGLPANRRLTQITESPDQQWVIGKDELGFYFWKKGQKALFKKIQGAQMRFTPDGKHCMVLSYRQRQCYLDIYDGRTLRKQKSVSSERYLPLSDYVFTDGSSISPTGNLVAFCAKRYRETKGIGIYDWKKDAFVSRIDSVALQGEDLRMTAQPYHWDGDEALIIYADNKHIFFRCPLQETGSAPFKLRKGITQSGLNNLKMINITNSGLYQAAYRSMQSRSMAVHSTSRMPHSPPHIISGRYLASSPNSQYIFLQKKDSTFGFIKTADIQGKSIKIYPFAIEPYIPGQEDVILEDTQTPDDYEHLYLAEERKWEQAKKEIEKFQLQQKSIYVHGDTVSWQMQLTDEEGNFYTQALMDSSIWCHLEVTKGDSTYTIPRDQWRLKEVNSQDTLPIAMAIVMDHSGSMGNERAFVVQHAVDSLLANKRPKDTVALMKYDSDIGIESNLCSDKTSLRQRLQHNGLGTYGGGTAILDAVDMATDMLEPVQGYGEKAIIIFTDGQENSSMLTQGEVISKALQRGIKIYAIGFGAAVDTAYLKQLSEVTGGHYAQIYQTSDFSRIFEDSYKRLTQYYTIETTLAEAGNYQLKLSLCLPTEEVSLTTNLKRWNSPKEAYKTWLEEDANRKLAEEKKEQDSLFGQPPHEGLITLLDVNFHFDATTITPASMPEIKKVGQYMTKYPHISIELRGHTDNVGNDKYNLKLSQRRAMQIRKLLIEQGIEEHRLLATGFGEEVPVADNTTETGRAKNRRTEFMIITSAQVRKEH